MRKLITKLLLFLIPFLALNMILKSCDTYSGIDVLGDKFDYFSKHKDMYNAVFIGSSGVYRQLVPELFDETLHANGYSIKSFNFGVPGMHPPESYFVAKKIIDMNPEKLEWVILELGDFLPYIEARNLHTRKSIYWHNVEYTLMVSGAILLTQSSTQVKSTHLYNNAMLFCKNLTNAGRGPSLLEWILRSYEDNERENNKSIGPRSDGYMPLENENTPHFRNRRKNFIKKKDEYREKIALLLKGEEQKYDLIPDRTNYFEVKALVDTIEYIKGKGAKPIFLLPQRIFNIKKLLQLHQKGIIPNLIHFQNPHEYPMFYDAEYRFDRYHLNRNAAQEFTKLVAERCVDIMAAE